MSLYWEIRGCSKYFQFIYKYKVDCILLRIGILLHWNGWTTAEWIEEKIASSVQGDESGVNVVDAVLVLQGIFTPVQMTGEDVLLSEIHVQIQESDTCISLIKHKTLVKKISD